MAPALDFEGERGVDERPDPVAFDGEFGERGGDVDPGERRAEAAQGLGLCETGFTKALEDVELELERAVGGGGDPRLEVDKRARGEAHGAGHGLAMDEGRVEWRLQ